MDLSQSAKDSGMAFVDPSSSAEDSSSSIGLGHGLCGPRPECRGIGHKHQGLKLGLARHRHKRQDPGIDIEVLSLTSMDLVLGDRDPILD